jgi:RNA polymerase sigma factor (sigma-70 family)
MMKTSDLSWHSRICSSEKGKKTTVFHKMRSSRTRMFEEQNNQEEQRLMLEMLTSKRDNVPSIKPLNDEDLVALAKLGQEEAFAELWRRHSTKIHRTLCRITRHSQDAEDALQDTFLKVHLHLSGFDGRSKFSTWLTRIAINSALMVLRKRRRCPQLSMDCDWGSRDNVAWDVPDRSPSAETLVLHQELLSHLDAAVERLRPAFREIINLQLSDESSNLHIAKRIGISLPATKSRALRARGALRKSLLRTIGERTHL